MRALQLELHPDKQPEQRRSAVQPLFLLVQKEWESLPEAEQSEHEMHEMCERHEKSTKSHSKNRAPQTQGPSSWEWARRQATAFSEDAMNQGPNASRSRHGFQRNRRQQGQEGATNNFFKPAAATNSPSCSFNEHEATADTDTDDGEDRNQIEMGTHWTPEQEDDEDTGIVPLLATRIFENVMHAFSSIQLARRSRGLDAEKPGHPWRAKMDRLEAEAWRLYAKQQCEGGFHKFAVAEHLHKAINLYPARGELYLDRARSRLNFVCPALDLVQIQTKVSSEMQLQILEDCEAALARDSSLLDAFDLAIRLRYIRFELVEVQTLAAQGRRSALVSCNARAGDFTSWRRCAKAVSRGLERAQGALKVAQPQSSLVSSFSLYLGSGGPKDKFFFN